MHPKEFLKLEKGQAVLLTTAPFGVYKMRLTAPSRSLKRRSYSERKKQNYTCQMFDFYDYDLTKFVTEEKKNMVKYFVQGYPIPDEYYVKASLKNMKICGRGWDGNLRQHFKEWVKKAKEEGYEFDWEYQQVLSPDKIYTLENFDSKVNQPAEWCL